MNSHSSLLEREYDDSDVECFRCPTCGFTAENEGIVRVHIIRSEDNSHPREFAFMPEVSVEAIGVDETVVETIDGDPQLQYQLETLETQHLDSRVSERESIAVLAALHEPRASFSEIQSLANEKLRARGLDELDYNEVYRRVVETLALSRTPRGTPTSKTGKNKSYEDLTEKQRAVINHRVRDREQSLSTIAEKAGVSISYPNQVLEKYEHISDEMSEEDIEPVNRPARKDSNTGDIEKMSSESETKTEDSEEYRELTALQRQVIDQLVEHPNRSNKNIAAEVGCDASYPEKLQESFSALIERRQVAAGIIEAEERTTKDYSEDSSAPGEHEKSSETDSPEVSDDPASKTESGREIGQSVEGAQRLHTVPEDVEEEFEARTKKQKAVLLQLAEESDPINTSTAHVEIGENAGVHQTYVSEVIDKYGYIAVAIKNKVDLSTAKESISSEKDEESTSERETETQPEHVGKKLNDSVDSGRSDEETKAAGEVITANDELSSGTSIPLHAVKEVRERMDILKRTAQSEIESGNQEGSPHGRKTVASEAVREIDQLIQQYDGDTGK